MHAVTLLQTEGPEFVNRNGTNIDATVCRHEVECLLSEAVDNADSRNQKEAGEPLPTLLVVLGVRLSFARVLSAREFARRARWCGRYRGERWAASCDRRGGLRSFGVVRGSFGCVGRTSTSPRCLRLELRALAYLVEHGLRLLGF